ncbi:MAG: acetolactate synthase [Alteromonadaceae bacterium]|nr:MAG: acetolactate synthase [Alteromonadaceae bacterium]
MADDEALVFDDLDMRMGQTIHLISSSKSGSAGNDCILLGAIPDESLILTAPSSGVFPSVSEGESVIIRSLQADGVVLFDSTVLFVTDVPMFMVYIDFPTNIQFKKIRNASRVHVSLPVLVSNLTTKANAAAVGKVCDISTTGAALEMSESVGGVGDNLSIKGKFKIGSIQRMLAIKGVIRSRKTKKNGAFVYGVEFHEGDEDDLIILFGFIFNAMAFGKIQKIR